MPKMNLNDNQIGHIYLNGRRYGGILAKSEAADLFNHGDTIGLNSNVRILQCRNQSSPYFVFNDTTTQDYLISNGGASFSHNTSLLFYAPFSNKKYTKFYIELEIPAGYGNTYQHLDIGVIKTDQGVIQDSLINIALRYNSNNGRIDGFGDSFNQTLISYSDQYNILNYNPWYQMPKHIFCFQVPTDTEFNFYPYVEIGFETAIIYSAWVES